MMETDFNIPKEIKRKIHAWLQAPIEDTVKEEIRYLIQNNPAELIDGFSDSLRFGTSGLRALMGVGLNRMNMISVQWISQAFAQYFLKESFRNNRILIAYDNRKNSKLFAKKAAQIFARNNMNVFLFSEPRPVPYLSFGIRHLECGAGIMITASHNPKEYNGYKIYWADGGEISTNKEKEIEEEMNKIDALDETLFSSKQTSLINELDPDDLDKKYLSLIINMMIYKNETQTNGKDLKIVYSSLHGTGITLAPKALQACGFSSLFFVSKQCVMDDQFSTVSHPNPEYPEALSMGIQTLSEHQGDLLIVNDPDANRIGVAVSHHDQIILLNGNEFASLCAYFLCIEKQKIGVLPKNGAFISTIVTTELLKKIAESFGLFYFETHTGFKFIAEKIHEWEDLGNPAYAFLFGAEESYGCLATTAVRDKDGIAAACLIAEMTLSLKQRGLTLIDFLYQIYQKFGIFREIQYSLSFSSTIEGRKKIEMLMSDLRHKPLSSIGSYRVLYMEDYQEGWRKNVQLNKLEKLDLPKSDVLLYRLEEDGKIVIRPSGTENKIRIHIAVKEPAGLDIPKGIKTANQKLETLKSNILEMIHCTI